MAARAAIVAASAVGLVVAARGVDRSTVEAVEALLGRLGWRGSLAYGAYSLAVFPLLGAAWLVVMGEPKRRLATFAYARMVREAASDLLPFSQLGGIVVGANVLVARGLSAAGVYAGIAADLATELASQALFTGLGIGWWVVASTGPVDAPLRATVACSVAAIAAVAVGARLAPRWLPWIAPRLLEQAVPRSVGAVRGIALQLGLMYARRDRMVVATLLNLAAWAMSACGAWVVLRWIGVDASVPRIASLEAIVFALRSVAFMVPGGVGVQEAAYVLLAPAFGLQLEAVATLAVAKRVRDVGIGVPTLLAWQWTEARHVARALRRRTADRRPFRDAR